LKDVAYFASEYKRLWYADSEVKLHRF
jgi:hypothetical protein